MRVLSVTHNVKVLSSTVLARGATAGATVQSLFGPSAGVSAQVLSIESSDRRHTDAVGIESIEARGFLGLTHNDRVPPS